MVEKIKSVLRKHQERIPIIVMAEILAVMDEEEEKPKYDVEKVIFALECEKTIWCGKKITTTDTMKIDDAIEIVRKGGVD